VWSPDIKSRNLYLQKLKFLWHDRANGEADISWLMVFPGLITVIALAMERFHYESLGKVGFSSLLRYI